MDLKKFEEKNAISYSGSKIFTDFLSNKKNVFENIDEYNPRQI